MYCIGKIMSYYLLALIVAIILSFYLAIRNERKFQNQLDELELFREEIKGFSIRIEKLNKEKTSTKEANKIIFQRTYALMDYNAIINDSYENPVETTIRRSDLIRSSFNYGQEKKSISPYKFHQVSCSKKRGVEAKKYFSLPIDSHELLAS
jgi:hypothetical protein